MQKQNHIQETSVEPALVTSVVALGRIEPEGEVIKLSVPNAQDSRVNKILVKEGDFVNANQVIAILQGIERREADLSDAQTDVRLKQAELAKIQQGDAKKAQLAMQRAAIASSKAQRIGEIKQKKAAIASTEATLREAQLTYQRRQALASNGAISRADRDSAQRELATTQATLAERKADLEQTEKTLQSSIAQERAKLAQLQEVRPVDIEIARAQLDKAKIAVNQRKADLEDAKVRVPIAGQILKINTRIGEQVNTSQGIVELAQTNRMYAIAEISETDINKVRMGQQAVISSEYGGFTGEIQGVVEQIGLQIGKQTLQDADSSSASGNDTGSPTTDQNARVIAVKVRITPKDSPKVAALTNMQVRVKLDIATNNNAAKVQEQIPPSE
ncbi:MAG: HlyD family efflux transporter periplasmic adaptor subunit [Nostoc sp. DedSLP03]|uniref:HlyD family efflux transporter periplasmic adaptor subunit n=1 Tax=Nostoc sp. DedSLP03 TaxID=3075400 RepID=UPI002AD28FE1|nr:HlyD family efflux transporter periplasmic adaptor subunit [Nostoc sp. DedSLP03]MDZ7968677.1 HlyD family efflux transporter periplasmic adaptor subunit [Nostoc sp. DedSLP03]